MSLNTLTNIAYLIYNLCKHSADSIFVVKQLLRYVNHDMSSNSSTKHHLGHRTTKSSSSAKYKATYWHRFSSRNP
jgi:hypothetical protein